MKIATSSNVGLSGGDALRHVPVSVHLRGLQPSSVSAWPDRPPASLNPFISGRFCRVDGMHFGDAC